MSRKFVCTSVLPLPIVKLARIALAVVAALIPGLHSEAQEMVPFPIDWDSHHDTVLDLSGFLEKPAGGSGFVRTQGEHFVDGSGKRLRMWGINLGATLCFPSHDEAERTADTFARLGFNCIRFHGMDSSWGRSSLERGSGESSSLDEENMERFDYFVHQLKQRGIYVNLNLNTFRTYEENDGVPNPQELGLGKWATHFHPRLIELQEKYARDILSRKNRYTGNTYANEPAIIVVEIVNENSLIEGWLNGKLAGVDDNSGDTWSPLPTIYAAELNRQYNEWLKENRTADQVRAFRVEANLDADQPLALLKKQEFGQASEARFRADYDFIVETEHAYLSRMKTLIKDEIGLKSMLIGDADHNDSINGYSHIVNNSMFDYIDGHGYWQHPSLGDVTRTKNDPMVNDPFDSTVAQFARTPMVGMPFVISETNHPFPHRFASEGIPIVTAYALLHDWDGLLFHQWGEGLLKPAKAIPPNSWFRISYNPMKLSQLMVAGLMWHRRDIEPARQRIIRSVTSEQIFERTRWNSWEHRPFFDPEFDIGLTLTNSTRWQLVKEPVRSSYPGKTDPDHLVSDTRQLRWHGSRSQRGRVVIDAPRVQSLIGFQRGLRNQVYRGSQMLSSHLKNEFAAVTLLSLDGEPIADSKRMILFAGDRFCNSDMTWRDDLQTVASWGDGPASIRPATGVISVWGLRGDAKPIVRVLDALGKPTGDRWNVWRDKDGWTIQVGQPAGLMAIIER